MATLSRKNTTGSTKSSGRSSSSSNSRSAEKVDERRSLDENRSQMEGDGLLKDALHSDAEQHVKAAQAIEQSASVGSSRGSSFEDKMQSVLDDAAGVRSFGDSRTSGFAESKSTGLDVHNATQARLDAGGQSREQLNQGRADLAARIEVEGSNNSASRESGVSVGYSQGVSETAGTAKSWSTQSGRGELGGSSESASQERSVKVGKDDEARTSASTGESASRSETTSAVTSESASYGRSASINSAASGVETSLSVAECSQQSNVERITVGQALDELDPRSGEALLNGQKISNSSHETISRSFEDDNGSSVREGLSSERSVTYDLDEGAGDVVKTLKQSFCETSTQIPSQSLGSESAMESVGSDLSMLRSQESASIREQALESLQQTEQARNNQEPEAEAAAEAEEEMDMSD